MYSIKKRQPIKKQQKTKQQNNHRCEYNFTKKKIEIN